MLKIILAFLLVLIPANGWCVTQWTKASMPATGNNLTDWPTQVNAQWSIIDTLLSNYRKGFTLTYSSGSTLALTAGELTVSNSTGATRLFLQKASSTNVTFSNIDTGVEAPSTTYYVYAGTSTATDAAPTFYISLSASAPTGVTYYVRLGSFYNDSSSNITTIDNDNITGEANVRSSKTVGSVYQALTDGEACGLILTAGSGTSGYLTGYTDNSSSPTTALGYASANENSQADHSITRNSFCVKVKAGDYYQITQTTWAGASSGGTATMYFQTTN